MSESEDEWWKEYFRRDRLLMEPIHKSAEDFIEPALGLPDKSKILDLGCGYGRNSIALARNGYFVVGLDYCQELLDIARTKAQEAGVHVRFLRADMRQIPFGEANFDSVLSWSGSFGYFSDQENVGVVRSIAGCLVPGGKFILDIPNRDSVLRNHLGKTWHRNEEALVVEDRQFDCLTSRWHVDYTIILPRTGEVRKGTMTIRLYSFSEITRIVEDAGLEVLEVYGEPTSPPVPLSVDSGMIINYFYVRVSQLNGQLAWSSPIWVDSES